MARKATFTFRLTSEENRQISILAGYLRRTKSDALRILISDAVRQIGEANQPTNVLDFNDPRSNEEVYLSSQSCSDK